MRGHDLPRAIDEVESQLRARHGYAEVYQAIKQATEVARRGPGPEHIESLGGGWVAVVPRDVVNAVGGDEASDAGGRLLGLLCLKWSRAGFCTDADVAARAPTLRDRTS